MTSSDAGVRGPDTPRAPAVSVRRPRLEERFDDIPPGGVGLLVAPAGSGKTVLLTQWSPSPRRARTCWVAVTAAHNDAAVLARDLISALHGVHPDLDPSIRMLANKGGGALGPAFVDAVVGELSSIPADDVVVVLDDTHHLTNRAIAEDIDRLLRRLPDNVRVLIGSRWDPPFAVARLRLDQRLVELRAVDLAFDLDEAHELVAGVAEREISREQLTSLVVRTDGWGAGLQLAAISMQRAPDIDDFVESFDGNDRVVADYLTQEVLRYQDDRTRRFLLRTSILEWLAPDLCAAVTGEEHSQAMLDELVRRSVFIVPAEPGSSHLRYHHLFADLLRYQLRSEDKTLERRLRSTAADWLLARGELVAGVEQLLAADEHERAFDVIASEGHRLFERGESATLVRWLTSIAARDTVTSPALAVNLLAAQSAADEYTAAAETYRVFDRRSDLSAGARTAADALYSVAGLADLPTAEVYRVVDRVLHALPTLDDGSLVDFLGIGGVDSVETMVRFARSMADLYDAELSGAVAGLEEVLELPGAAYPIWRINALSALALTRAWTGRLNESQRLATTALETARDLDALHHISATFAHLALAMTAHERIETDTASLYLHEAVRCAGTTRRASYHHLCRLLEARLAALTDGPKAALQIVREPSGPGLERPLLSTARAALEAQLLLTEGALDEAEAVLDDHPAKLPAERVDLLLARGDVRTAREVLVAWEADPSNPREAIEREVREALVAAADGRVGAAGTLLTQSLARAEAEQLRRPFVEAPDVVRILRTAAPRRPSPFLASVLDAPLRTATRDAANDKLVDSLSDRERSVLEYLPTRLANREIAESLYISVNTLKTHLRHIYQKLDVEDRDAAVAHAIRLGLL